MAPPYPDHTHRVTSFAPPTTPAGSLEKAALPLLPLHLCRFLSTHTYAYPPHLSMSAATHQTPSHLSPLISCTCVRFNSLTAPHSPNTIPLMAQLLGFSAAVFLMTKPLFLRWASTSALRTPTLSWFSSHTPTHSPWLSPGSRPSLHAHILHASDNLMASINSKALSPDQVYLL